VKVGGAAGAILIVKAAEAAALVERPAATAMASTVSVVETVIGPEYTAEPVVGTEPFVV
jgi:hypothetical protein